MLRILAIGGGKGGVGKSLVSTNLAVALAKTGARVVLLDADLGAPNLHTMFGMMRPPRTVEDFLAGRSATLEEVALATPVPGLRVICGAEGALGSADPTFQAKQQLLDQLARLDADCLLIDVGAGVDLNTIDFFNAADARLVVMVPEVTSLQNGYAFLKIALFRRLQRATAGLRVSEKLAGAFDRDAFEVGSTLDRVSTFLTLLEDEVPELAAQFQKLLQEFNAKIVGNMLHRSGDRNALYAMQRLIRERLSIEIEVAATIRQNEKMRASVNSGKPFMTEAKSNDPDVFELTQLATRLMQQDLAPLRKLREDFLRAMSRRPVDPALDQRFQFGLEGVALGRSVVREPRPPKTAEQEAFRSEFHQLQRASERFRTFQPVEVSFDGRWYLGRLEEVNEGGGALSGIRAEPSWQSGALRLAGADAAATGVAIALHSYDAASDKLVVRFVDPKAAAHLVEVIRKRMKS